MNETMNPLEIKMHPGLEGLFRPIPVGETRTCGDREYVIHKDGSWRRKDKKRQIKGKTWRNNRNK